MLTYSEVLALVVLLAALSDVISMNLARRYAGTATRVRTNPSSRLGSFFDWLPAVVLIVFLGTRDRVGTDYPLYEQLFNRVSTESWRATLADSPQEAGFTLLQVVSKSAGADFHGFLLTMAALTVVPVVLALRRDHLSVTVGMAGYVLLGHYLAAFNIVRQSLAMSLLWLAVAMLPRRLWFWSIVAIASTVHASVIPVAIALYMARELKPSLRLLVAAVGLGGVLAVTYLSTPIIYKIAVGLNPRYSTYLVGDRSGLGSYLIAAVHIALVAVLLIHSEDQGDRAKRYTTYAMLGLPFIILGTQSVVLGRIELYFSIFLIPAYALCWKVLPLAVRTGICLLAVAYFCAYLASFGDLIPYNSTISNG